MTAVRMVRTRGGCDMPQLGQGTFRMGEDAEARAAEVTALKLGLDLGMTLIDTAEMYGKGRAEEIVGEAIKGRRDKVFLVSKVLPEHASRESTVKRCEWSLQRLRTDWIDLYLLHWRGPHPLSETFEAFERLVEAGKIRHYGVSNFDLEDLRKLERVPNGSNGVTNQVMYSLARRGIEWSLLPWCAKNAIAVMAYSPLDQGGLVGNPALAAVAKRHKATPEAVAIAWTMREPFLVSIPKAVNPEHVQANAKALEIKLTDTDLAELDEAFPAPEGAVPLDMS